ncbi:MAG: hypothetical protein KDD70_10460, partial [Bdellovibrionales bacterium]|nr:hypothetical protein [Bdellovibrionales bacterium]
MMHGNHPPSRDPGSSSDQLLKEIVTKLKAAAGTLLDERDDDAYERERPELSVGWFQATAHRIHFGRFSEGQLGILAGEFLDYTEHITDRESISTARKMVRGIAKLLSDETLETLPKALPILVGKKVPTSKDLIEVLRAERFHPYNGTDAQDVKELIGRTQPSREELSEIASFLLQSTQNGLMSYFSSWTRRGLAREILPMIAPDDEKLCALSVPSLAVRSVVDPSDAVQT